MKEYSFLIIIVMLFGLLFNGQFSVFQKNYASAQTDSAEINDLNKKIAESKAKIKELEETMETYQANIKKKRIEVGSLNNQLSIIDNRSKEIETDIELTEEKIFSAELEIKALEMEIENKQTLIDRQKEIIAELIRSANKESHKNYLQILLSAQTFSEFYDKLNSLQNMYEDMGESSKKLRLAKESFEQDKNLTQDRKDEYQNLKNDLVEKQKDLQEQTSAKTDLLVKTKNSEYQYTLLLDELKRQHQQIEDEVRAYELEMQNKLANEDKIPGSDGEFSVSWPTLGHYITSYFRDPDYPFRNVFEHSGIDVRAAQGTPLRAAASGYVARAVKCTSASCYSYTLIVHTGDMSTLYGHMSKVLVEADQYVQRGEIIGYSGGTPGTAGAGPFVTGPHLHFEVRKGGIPVNPLDYLTE